MDVDTALSDVPVNVLPLLDDTDFKSIEAAVAYNAAGLALYWHFVTTGGAYSVTAVTPTTGGAYDWTDQGDAGIYTIEIPASGGASINNDTEGFGWFTGVATGVLPWRGPVIGFRAAGTNDALIDSAWSATRGLAGTALPDAAAAANGGLPTTDGTKLSQTADLTAGQTIAATVAGDVGGKVLGGGAGTITGTGVRAVDGSGNAIAPASATTAIAAQLPAALVGGKIDAHINDIAAGAITAAAIATDAIDADALAADAVAEIANGHLDLANGIETGLTPRQVQRLFAAALAGKLSGAATATIVIRNAVADSKDRITATVDADGNRSAITVDLT